MRPVHPLWDLPTRGFHWLIVLCVGLSWWTGEEGDFERHQWSGYAALVLVIFRVIWGFVGSQHSLFRDFVSGPSVVWSYLHGRVPDKSGHNPVGGWSVLALLVLLLIQALSGLFNSDDLMFEAPFYYAATVEFRDAMGVVHGIAFNVLVGFIALHLLAVMYYQLRARKPLIQAMLRGSAPGMEGHSAPVPTWRALVLVALLAAVLWWAIRQAPQPQLLW